MFLKQTKSQERGFVSEWRQLMLYRARLGGKMMKEKKTSPPLSALGERNAKQLREAVSDDNKWYFGIYHKRPHHNNDELVLFYIEHGGALGYAKRNAKATIQEIN